MLCIITFSICTLIYVYIVDWKYVFNVFNILIIQKYKCINEINKYKLWYVIYNTISCKVNPFIVHVTVHWLIMRSAVETVVTNCTVGNLEFDWY